MLRVLDLFSGIGGFSLGLERTGGFKTVAFCEIDPYCRKVLAKHWPDVPCYDDIRELTAARLAADGIAVDAICGGFPCQDLSHAGKRTGIEGARSGLWSEFHRLIRELFPLYAIVENVPGLLSLGMGTVLRDLAEIGFDATWDCIPASAIGAPHRRDRVWIVAHARRELGTVRGEARHMASASRASETHGEERQRNGNAAHDSGADVADAEISGLEGWTHSGGAEPGQPRPWKGGWAIEGNWLSEPDVGRVAHGVPSRVDRLRALGNAVVPQIPELIGRAILKAEKQMRTA